MKVSLISCLSLDFVRLEMFVSGATFELGRRKCSFVITIRVNLKCTASGGLNLYFNTQGENAQRSTYSSHAICAASPRTAR